MYTIFTDGASRGNPGQAAWAFVVTNDNMQIFHADSGFIGHGTNNDAEYCAVIKSMEWALASGVSSLRILSDSEIVIRQLTGMYRCKEPRLQSKKAIVESYSRRISTQFGNVGREHKFIRHCDHMCNQVLDKEAKNEHKTNNDRNICTL